MKLILNVFLLLNTFFSVLSQPVIEIPSVIFPDTTNYTVTDFTSNYSYTMEYRKDIWLETKELSSPLLLSYNNLIQYKDYTLRYKLTDSSNNFIYSNNFNIAHIDLQHSIDKDTKLIHLDWVNEYFVGNNNLYLDYLFFNRTGNLESFAELNLTDSHTINITQFLDKYFLYDFRFIVKNTRYNLSSELDFKYDHLVTIETGGLKSVNHFCIEKICISEVKKEWQTCIHGRIYKSVCHAICYNEYFTKLDEFVRCDNSSSTTSSVTSTTQTSATLTTTTETTTETTGTATPITVIPTLTPTTTLPTVKVSPTTFKIIKKLPEINYTKYENSFELLFSGIQSCKNYNTCPNSTRFSVSKQHNHTIDLLINMTVDDCFNYCIDHVDCEGVYIFYTITDTLRCRYLTYLGSAEGKRTYLHDYSFKFIGNRSLLTTPTTTETSSITSTPTTTETSSITSTPPITETFTKEINLSILTNDTTTIETTITNSIISIGRGLVNNSSTKNKNNSMGMDDWIFIGVGAALILFLLGVLYVVKRNRDARRYKANIAHIQRSTRTYNNPVYENPDQNEETIPQYNFINPDVSMDL